MQTQRLQIDHDPTLDPLLTASDVCVDCKTPTRHFRCEPCEQKHAIATWRELRTKQFVSMCPPLYQETDPQRLPQAQLAKVMAWKRGPRGLLLTGPTGLGKTRSMWLLIRRLMIENLIDVRALDCVAFGHEITRRFADDDDAIGWLDRLAEVPVLFLDDLAKDRLTERVEMELFGLIERRTANKLPLLITTNDTGQALANRLSDNRGPALIRRLREFCDVVQFADASTNQEP